MPRRRKNEQVRCVNFTWVLVNRSGTWYADGRSNSPNPGRHSLGTKSREEALRLLVELDRVRAEDLGLIPKTKRLEKTARMLELEEGRKLYEKHYKRPLVAGGVKPRTAKKYGSVFDKFIPYAKSRGVTVWNGVTDDVLIDYASHLEKLGYAHKSEVNELITLKQALKWLVKRGHLQGMPRSDLKVKKAESEPAYCWRPEEVEAMINHCRANDKINWLGGILVGLACTGLRIGEFAQLRWADIDTDSGCLILKDESGYRRRSGRQRRGVKNRHGRSFPIHDDFAAILKNLTRIDGHLFHGPRGGRLKPDTVRNVLVREVIKPLEKQFPTADDERGFRDGRFHSFRHFFCSTCANSGVPERMVMEWLGHADSDMVRHYYHLHDDDSRRHMNKVDFLGSASGRSAGHAEDNNEEDAEPPTPEACDDRPAA